MRTTLKNHLPFLICLGIYFIALGALLRIFEKGQIEIWINRQHNIVADFFFKYWTFVGDGIFVTIVIVLLLFYRYYYAFFCLFAILIKTAIVQYLKLNLYHYEPRPKMFLKDIDLYFVEGVEIFGYNSFPSGHTSQAFCMVTVLALIAAREGFKNQNLIQIGLFLVALLVGLSRVYLLQHFVKDIFAGAGIGCAVAYLVYIFFESQMRIRDSIFLQGSLIKRRAKPIDGSSDI